MDIIYRDPATGETFTEQDAYELYDTMLDEVCGPVRIGNLEYLPSGVLSDVLSEVDPIAYRVGFSDYVDSLGWEEV